MVRTVRQDQAIEAQLSVWLKNGESYMLCDVPDDSFAITGCVAFWVSGALAIVPLEQVLYTEMNFEPGNDDE